MDWCGRVLLSVYVMNFVKLDVRHHLNNEIIFSHDHSDDNNSSTEDSYDDDNDDDGEAVKKV